MSLYDVIFWLLIVFVAALAFAIESGITARHRRVVLSSIFATLITALYMMLTVEDNSRFAKPPPPEPAAKNKMAGIKGLEGDGGIDKLEVETVDLTNGKKDDKLGEAERLLSMAGGFTECAECPLMVGVQGGSYIMGSPLDEAGRQPGEGPRKKVVIRKPFAVSRYEIKRIEYARFVKDARHHSAQGCYVNGILQPGASWIKPGFDQGDHDPVVCISWKDALAYTKWLSKRTKREYRLLSESEWEFIARAGTKGAYWQGRAFGHETALFGSVHDGTRASGSYPENAFKVFDTSGSVWEFTADCYVPNLAMTPANGLTAPEKPGCKLRVVRGGAWDSPAERVRSASRQGFRVEVGANNTGIRVARVLYEDKPAAKTKDKKGRKGRRRRRRRPMDKAAATVPQPAPSTPSRPVITQMPRFDELGRAGR